MPTLALVLIVLFVLYCIFETARVIAFRRWQKKQPFCPPKSRETLLREVKDFERRANNASRFISRNH